MIESVVKCALVDVSPELAGSVVKELADVASLTSEDVEVNGVPVPIWLGTSELELEESREVPTLDNVGLVENERLNGRPEAVLIILSADPESDILVVLSELMIEPVVVVVSSTDGKEVGEVVEVDLGVAADDAVDVSELNGVGCIVNVERLLETNVEIEAESGAALMGAELRETLELLEAVLPFDAEAFELDIVEGEVSVDPRPLSVESLVNVAGDDSAGIMPALVVVAKSLAALFVGKTVGLFAIVSSVVCGWLDGLLVDLLGTNVRLPM